jgi:hypothetical protein
MICRSQSTPEKNITERAIDKANFPNFAANKQTMSHVLFYGFFPDLASKETRAVTITGPNPEGHEPGPNAFIEHYCIDADCDCRNVYIQIVKEHFPGPLATITYGWESKAYYKKWMGDADDDELLTDFMGPSLAVGSRQSPYADHWLRVFKNIIQKDKAYVLRLQRHYKLMKTHVGTKS